MLVCQFLGSSSVRLFYLNPHHLARLLVRAVSWLDGLDAKECTLGLCYCPGKNVVREGVRWERDLDADLRQLTSTHGVKVVVCLLSDAELRALGVGRDYAARVRNAGLELVQLPIVEMFAPADMHFAAKMIDLVLGHLESGRRTVLHCRGGVGRAGMLGACLLIRMGLASGPGDAIKLVRRRRCKRAVESRSQEKFIVEYTRFRADHAEDGSRGLREEEDRQAGKGVKAMSRMPPTPVPLVSLKSRGQSSSGISERFSAGTGRRSDSASQGEVRRVPHQKVADQGGSREDVFTADPMKSANHCTLGGPSRSLRAALRPQLVAKAMRGGRGGGGTGGGGECLRSDFARGLPNDDDETLRELIIDGGERRRKEEGGGSMAQLDREFAAQCDAVKEREKALEEELARCDELLQEHVKAARTDLRRGPLPAVPRRTASAFRETRHVQHDNKLSMIR